MPILFSRSFFARPNSPAEASSTALPASAVRPGRPAGEKFGNATYAIDAYTPMVYNVRMIFVETRLFTSRILDAMSDDEYAGLQNHLSQHPDAGALIPGTGGVRKVRWAGSGRGKRGGSRLIYYWDCGDRILMLYVYLKNERENLTEGQKKLMKEIAEGYKHE